VAFGFSFLGFLTSFFAFLPLAIVGPFGVQRSRATMAWIALRSFFDCQFMAQKELLIELHQLR
jgi:hypothetical protein